LENLQEVGIVGILVLLVLKEVFSFIKEKKRNGVFNTDLYLKQFAIMFKQSSDIHRILTKEDDEGIKTVYAAKGLGTAIINLGKNIDKQTEAIRELVEYNRKLVESFEKERT